MANNIVLYNSWSKKKEVLRTNEPGVVRIYNCGPTVYKRAHIGNLRRYLFADILRRTLEMHGYEVQEVTNITDVGHLTQDEIETGEDKMEKEAKAKKMTVSEIAEREINNFKKDLSALNIQTAAHYPRATEHIKEMIDMIRGLIDKGYAYTTPVGVFFEVDKFKPYGKLSGNTVDKLAEGARLAVRKEKKRSADFALWLTDDHSHMQLWDSPWGRGYPGWHIECSAMSLKYLGKRIDIHTGGEDNKFPHHENEIAQSEAATGEKFVKYWMHNAHLQINGEKLAKSGKEQITLDTVREYGFSPLVFRWLVIGSHYRSRIEFTWDKMSEAQTSLDKIKTILRRLIEGGVNEHTAERPDSAVMDQFRATLADDLNTPSSLAVVLQLVGDINRRLDSSAGEASRQQYIDQAYATLADMDRVLGVVSGLEKELQLETVPTGVINLAKKREAARSENNFEEADLLKEKIIAAGFMVEDTSNGYRLLKKTK